jgi:hypothetical protein
LFAFATTLGNLSSLFESFAVVEYRRPLNVA